MSLSDIYPELDNLSPFVHPVYNRTYSFLLPNDLFDLCHQLIAKIRATHINNVLVLESGAVPLAEICEMIGKKHGYTISWFHVKIPRDVGNCLYQTLLYYDNKHSIELLKLCNNIDDFFKPERRSLKHALQYIERYISKNPYINAIREKTKSSKLANILKNEFVIFDEYVDSGKTLVNSIKLFHLFADRLNYQIVCYLARFADGGSNRISALYDANNENACYEIGAYPFENRIDLIGYFYCTEDNKLQKVHIQELYKKCIWHNQDTFLNLLYDALAKDDMLIKIKCASQIKSVANYIEYYHLIQFLLFTIEKLTVKEEKIIEFFYQLFDMYGPIWSPLPDDYHLDFLQAFTVNEDQFTKLVNNDIIRHYVDLRMNLVSAIAEICLDRHKKFWHEITNYIS